ncbi:MAG: ABC transporter ATP-binding protein [Proteobacteria bacterium]|nr:ABC transporter ATP-binding protein [Pseudomonadota bacterium]
MNPAPGKFDAASENLDNEVVVSIRNVSKKFCKKLRRSMAYGITDLSKNLVGLKNNTSELRKDEFWALNDINFELKKGESIGLIGANGSGKTTLLRLIAGIFPPDNGEIIVKGRIGALIAIGAGFHPHMTGRENIYLNGTILGMTRDEINSKFKDIIEFAEIGDFLDAPVSTYSSGMRVRLGFSIAIHKEPDILLIDEILAVGDAYFRTKCYQRLSELIDKSVVFILVSHNPEAILSTCQKAIYLSNGEVKCLGDVDSVMRVYEEDTAFKNLQDANIEKIPLVNASRGNKDGVSIESVYFRNSKGEKISVPSSGENVFFCIKCKSDYAIKELTVRISIFKIGENNSTLFLSNTRDENKISISEGINEIQTYLPYLGLMPGSYRLSTAVVKGMWYELDVVLAFSFKVGLKKNQSNLHRSKYYQHRTWKVSKTTNYNEKIFP